MLDTEQINDLHRLYWSEHWPIRKIEKQLNIGWKTIRKYLDAPAQNCAHRDRPSKLDPFKAAISEWIEKDSTVTAAVIEQRLRAMGYDGGHSILRGYVRNIRPKAVPRQPSRPSSFLSTSFNQTDSALPRQNSIRIVDFFF